MLKIHEGNKDDIEVWTEPNNNRVVISTPNNYDAFWSFNRKDDKGVPYAERQGSEDPSRAYFTISLDRLSSDKSIGELNQKVNAARGTCREILNEIDDMEYIVAFDRSEGATPQFKHFMKRNDYAIGKVVHAGKFIAVLEQGESNGKKYFQVVQNNAVLQGREEFLNREEAVKKHFPMGEMRYMTVAQNGRITVTEYTPKKERELHEPQKQLSITREEKNALMAFAEHFGQEWKGVLIANWNVSKYPQVPSHDSEVLDGLREVLGVRGLLELQPKDLFLGAPSNEAVRVQPQHQRANSMSMGRAR